MADKEEKKDGPYLYITQFVEYRTQRWKVRPVYRENNNLEEIKFYTSYGDGKEWDDFEIGAYFWDKDDIRKRHQDGRLAEYPDPIFGEKYGYAKSFVDNWEVKNLAKWLAVVERSMTKQYNQYGNYKGFGEFVLRVAIAIKAKGFVRPLNEKDHLFNRQEYSWIDPSSAKWFIDCQHREYIKSCLPEEPKEEAA